MTGNISDDPWHVGVASGRIQLLSPTGYFLCGIYLTILGILATFGNGLVFYVLIRKKELRRKPHNMLLINMAASDLFISAFGYPFTTVASYKHRYIFGWFYCIYQGFITSLCAIGTMNTLVAISIYRYLAVCKPQWKHLLTLETTRIVLLVIWTYTLFWTGAPLAGWNAYTIEPFGTSCSIDWTSNDPYDIMYVYCLIGLFYILNISIMTFCYYNVVCKSRRLKLNTEASFDVDEAKKYHRLKMEVKVTGMCLLIVLLYILVWSPYAIMSLASAHFHDLPLWLTTLPTMFAKLASMLNPFVYVATNTSFKKAAKTAFLEKRNRVHAIQEIRKRKREKAIYTVDRTKEGIYIGRNEVHITAEEKTFF